MSFARTMLTTLAAASALAIASPVAAHAVVLPTNVILIEGSGNIAGGLPCTGCAITFDFTAVNAGIDEPGVYTGCHFAGTPDATDDNLSGAGSGTLSGCPASGTVTYSRTGVLVQVAGTINSSSGNHNIAASALLFIPTSANPVTTFIVVGAVVGTRDVPVG